MDANNGLKTIALSNTIITIITLVFALISYNGSMEVLSFSMGCFTVSFINAIVAMVLVGVKPRG